jgi:hypothetical protein
LADDGLVGGGGDVEVGREDEAVGKVAEVEGLGDALFVRSAKVASAPEDECIWFSVFSGKG